MTKYNFLNELERRLAKLPEDERREILEDYEEHFKFAKEAQKSDDEVIALFGSPEKIAKEIINEAEYQKPPISETSNGGQTQLGVIFIICGLGFLNLTLGIPIIITIVGLIFSFGLAGTALLISPLLFLLVAGLGFQSFTWFEFFLSLTFCGFGLLMIIATYPLVKGFIKLMKRYLAFHLRVIKGGL